MYSVDLFLEDFKSHFKLDFIDKIIISFVFIIGAILCPFYVFADDTETITVDGVVPSLVIPSSGDGGVFVAGSTSTGTGYISIEHGYRYTVTNSSTGEPTSGILFEKTHLLPPVEELVTV